MLLQEQLDEEVEYSTEMYERAQLAEADLATLRADLAANQVGLCPSLVLARLAANCGAAKVLKEPYAKEDMQLCQAVHCQPA